MMVKNHVGNAARFAEFPDRTDDGITFFRVAEDEFPFLVVKRTGFGQDRIRNTYFADIVQESRHVQPAHIVVRQSHGPADGFGHAATSPE